MADNVQPDAGEQREESSSGLLLSVDPLQGAKNYKLSGDDSDSGDKGGLLGDDSSDSDGSDSGALGGDDSDSDGSDAGDSDGSDDGGESSDADGSDAGGIGADSDETDEQMNPLGIADTNVDGPDSDGTDAK